MNYPQQLNVSMSISRHEQMRLPAGELRRMVLRRMADQMADQLMPILEKNLREDRDILRDETRLTASIYVQEDERIYARPSIQGNSFDAVWYDEVDSGPPSWLVEKVPRPELPKVKPRTHVRIALTPGDMQACNKSFIKRVTLALNSYGITALAEEFEDECTPGTDVLAVAATYVHLSLAPSDEWE